MLLITSFVVLGLWCPHVHRVFCHEEIYALHDPLNESHVRSIILVTRDDSSPFKSGIRCQLMTDEELIAETLESSPNVSDVFPSHLEEADSMFSECNIYSPSESRAGSLTMKTDNKTEKEKEDEDEEKWKIIFPGTNWCGHGNKAKDRADLGRYETTDACCRSHDLCPDIIKAGNTKHNLTNNSRFTQLHCDCDERFFKCLENANTATGNAIGLMFFNILRRTCFTYDHPLSNKCKTYRSVLKLTCKEYEKDATANKTWYFMQPKVFKQLPNPITGLKSILSGKREADQTGPMRKR